MQKLNRYRLGRRVIAMTETRPNGGPSMEYLCHTPLFILWLVSMQKVAKAGTCLYAVTMQCLQLMSGGWLL